MNALEKSRLQRLLAFLSMGICDALQNGTISHREAELLAFSPRMMRLCDEVEAAEQLRDLIQMGTELDAVQRLIGIEEWNASLNKIRTNTHCVLEQLEPSNSQLNNWIDCLVGGR